MQLLLECIIEPLHSTLFNTLVWSSLIHTDVDQDPHSWLRFTDSVKTVWTLIISQPPIFSI